MRFVRMHGIVLVGLLALVGLGLSSCVDSGKSGQEAGTPGDDLKRRVEAFAPVRLEADISHLNESEREMLKLMFEAADIMDELFWRVAYGEKRSLLDTMTDPYMKDFATIHYGPWDRLDNNSPFVPGVGEKPKGANFYPADMTIEEYEALADPAKESMYTILRRNAQGGLEVIPYHVAFADEVTRAADLLDRAAALAEDAGLKNYLSARAEALRTDEYLESAMKWMDMRTNRIDFVVGPIENYEDHLFGRKAAFESFILIKDMEWSERLAHYASLLPELQEGLPVPAEYRAEKPGSNSDLGVYDVVYYAGDCNAGSKTIAINLPNDERVHLQKGSRKLQLRNAIQYKFDLIMKPIADVLLDESQLSHVSSRAFFENTLFHEVAHGLGIKQTIDGSQTCREALKETYSAIEEGKADVLGIYMIEQLIERGELKDADIMDYYVTFMAGIFRSIRFGAASAHGRANTVRFHYFKEMGAFTRNPETGRYTVDKERMSEAVRALSHDILILQGDGNYAGAKALLDEKGIIDPELQADLDRINEANIPIDLRFEQGPHLLGLE